MPKYSRLSFEERVRIEIYRSEGQSICEISRKLKRNKATISRELARFPFTYRAKKAEAQTIYFQRHRRKWQSKIENNPRLEREVVSHLRKRWSPEQISLYLKREFANDKSMQASHETIYTYIYVLSRGQLKKQLISYLRQKKKTRRREKPSVRRTSRDPDMISIEERPKHVEDRALPGDWEGDLIIGKGHKSAVGTLVERKTRSLILIPLGSDYRAETVRKAFERALKTLPRHMRQSLTYDRGSEMSQHKLFAKNAKMKVYFCHPASPWERGTCENTNGLIRDYFPKGTDFSQISRKEIKRVQDQLNERPRKTLGFRTPKEAFNEEILALR